MYRIVLVFCLIVTGSAFTQVNELWNSRYNGSGSGIDQPVDLHLDASGNTYVTGISNNGSDFDVVTIKYNAAGVLQWTNTYGGTGLDEPRAITADNAGNIIVVGSKFISGNDYDIFTLKLNSLTGSQLWQQTFTGSNLYDLGNDVAIDASNNVYVAGTYYQSSTNLDYILLKYSSAGTFQWANAGGSTNRADEGLLVKINNSGDAILGGTAEFTSATTYFDFRIMKINSAGTTVWSLTQDSGFGKLDKPRAMALDGAGNVFIGGGGFTTVANLEDMLLMKISDAGTLAWKNLYSGNNQANDNISAIAVDLTSNNVYVTGKAKFVSTAENFHTRAYNTTGALLWSSTYSSAGNNIDEATDIVLKNNFLYVTGYTFKSGQSNNFNTIKYDLLGNQKWRKTFNHNANQSDKSYKVLVDNQDNVFVTGASYGGASQNLDYATIKYCQLETIASADTSICIGSSVALTASATGGFNYIWTVISGTPISASTFSCTMCQSPTATPNITTTYAVRSENSIGCIDYDTVVVTVNAATKPIITGNPSLSFCVGNSTTLNVNNQTYNSYSWNNGGSTSQKTVTTAASHIVTVIDNNGCLNSDTVVTSFFSLPIVNAGPSQSICQGQSAQLQATGASSYIWNSSPSLSQYIIANPTAMPNSTQTYTVTGTDNNGCQASDNVTISVNSLPTISTSGPAVVCAGDSVQILASGASTYSWNNVNSLTNASIFNPLAFPSQNTSYTVTGTDVNNCQSQASLTISVNSIPFISAGVNQTICSGDSANLFATGGSTYLWQNSTSLSNVNISNPWASPLSVTNYIVKGTNANNCSNTDTVAVFVNALPNVNAGIDTVVCLFESVQLLASGAISYSWNPSPSLAGNNSSTPTVQPIVPTVYTVTGTNTNGCSASDNVLVSVYSLPNINAGPNLFVCKNDSIQLSTSGGVSYVWNFNQTLSQLNIGNPYASPTVNTTYFVTGTDFNGCKNTDNVLVSINSLPNIFAGNDLSVCAGSSAQLQASGGNTYSWDNTPSLNTTNIFNPTTNPLQITEWFYVTGFNNNNCSKRDSVKVTVNPLPAPPILTDTFPNIVSSYVFGNQWFFNGSYNNSLLNDTINYVNLGNLGTYTATHTDFNGCTSLQSNSINIISLVYDVSVSEFDLPNFIVYPNPVGNSLLNIQLSESADMISITDFSGKIVYQEISLSDGIHAVDMSNFENGFYLVTVHSNNYSKSLKIVKQQ